MIRSSHLIYYFTQTPKADEIKPWKTFAVYYRFTSSSVLPVLTPKLCMTAEFTKVAQSTKVK